MNKKSIVLSALFAALSLTATVNRANACIGAGEFFSVVHPAMLETLAQEFKLTVGDVLALRDYMKVISGKEHLTRMSVINGETYYLVSNAGPIELKTENDEAVTFQAENPVIYRSMGCEDHRKP